MIQGVQVRSLEPLSLIITLSRMNLDPLLSPLIMHTSQPSETHYYPVNSGRRILLHTHYPAPYIPRFPAPYGRGLDFVIYSSGSTTCSAELVGFTIQLDWFATLGRWASRYPTTLVSWAVGVVASVVFEAWSLSDKGHSEYLFLFVRCRFVYRYQQYLLYINPYPHTATKPFRNLCWLLFLYLFFHFRSAITLEIKERCCSLQSRRWYCSLLVGWCL